MFISQKNSLLKNVSVSYIVVTLQTKCGPKNKRGPHNVGTQNTMWTCTPSHSVTYMYVVENYDFCCVEPRNVHTVNATQLLNSLLLRISIFSFCVNAVI